MRKWILLAILAIGMLFLLAGCSGCSLTNAFTTAGKGDCAPTNTDGAETIAIAASTFEMGSLPADVGAKTDEQPQHEVSLGCFNIYKKEVTNAMYNKCVADGACFPNVQPIKDTPSEKVADPSFADNPVVGVDYNMAASYCAWAGGRLPTEAEWEYAARGTKTPVYPWGNDNPECSLANSKGCLTPDNTQKVGLLLAGESPLKLLDMAGNAWEWIFDWYAKDYYAQSAASNPIGPSNGYMKVVRSGGYNSISDLLRAANRHAGNPYTPYMNVGFRCVTGPIILPDSYTPPDPHKHGFPDHDSVDDDDPGNPDPQFGFSILAPDCPDPNGNLHIIVQIFGMDNPQMTSFKLDGVDFTCTWDAVNSEFECVGPEPQNANPMYQGNLCLHSDNVGDYCMPNFFLQKPQNCGDSHTPTDTSYVVDCPVNGLIPITITSADPITWTLAETVGGGPMQNCHYDSPTEYDCLAPAILENGQYHFHYKGNDANNNYDYNVYTNPDPNCNSEGGINPGAYCSEGVLKMDVFYWPAAETVNLLKTNGNDQPFAANGPGSVSALPDESLQGTQAWVQADLSNGNSYVESVDMPQCNGQKLTFSAYCDATNNTPTAEIWWLPGTDVLNSITINGLPANIVVSEAGHAQVAMDASFAGQPVAMEVCIQGRPCATKNFIASKCEPGEVTATAMCHPVTNEPMLNVFYNPAAPAPISTKINNAPASIFSSAPGYMGIDLSMFTQGWNSTLDVCLQNYPCFTQDFLVPVCEDAPGKTGFWAAGGCGGPGPMVDLVYWPDTETVASLKIDGVNVPWSPLDPNHPEHMHYLLDDTWLGKTFPVDLCLGNNQCFNQVVTIPADCKTPPGETDTFGTTFCENGIPIACIFYSPDVPQITSIDVEGDAYPCVLLFTGPPSDVHCPLLPSMQGTTITANFCPGNICQGLPLEVKTCNGTTEGCSCRIYAGECLSKTMFGFTVQTCSQNLVPGSVTANDGSQSYDCVSTGQPGAVYCTGSIPANPGPLTVCFTQQGSQNQQCCTLDGFKNAIPVCTSWTPPTVDCGLYKDSGSCKAAGCDWIIGPTGGGGSCK